MSTERRLEVFYDYNCPWCYLGTANTERLRREREIEIRWTLFPLHPEVPMEGMELAELFRGRSEVLAASKGRLKEAAAATGLPLVRRDRISNSRRAQELEKWAASLGKGDDFRRLTFHTYFAEGKDIAELSVLEEIVAAVGLPTLEVWDLLTFGTFGPAVEQDWFRARQLGVTVVPFYLYGEEPLVGYRPYEELLQLVDGAG
ncbi:MAG: DsbA family protein [Desulfuromonadaceae bacterium]|jgi:predicted DsbA family dithiol-disulfide isomerase